MRELESGTGYDSLPVAPPLIIMETVSRLKDFQRVELGSDESVLAEAFSEENPDEGSFLAVILRELSIMSCNYPPITALLDRKLRELNAPKKTLAYAMRYETAVRGHLIFSKGVALVAGKTVEDVHVFRTEVAGKEGSWLETAVMNRWQGKKALAEALRLAHRGAMPVLDDRWIYNERGGDTRRFARDGRDAQLLKPSGIILNFPGVAKRVA